jgi:hypothetical protein
MLLKGRVDDEMIRVPIDGEPVVIGRKSFPRFEDDARFSRTQLSVRCVPSEQLELTCQGVNPAAFRKHGDTRIETLSSKQTVLLGEGDEVWLHHATTGDDSRFTVHTETKKRARVEETAQADVSCIYRIGLGTLALGIMYPDNARPSREASKILLKTFLASNPGGRLLIDTSYESLHCVCSLAFWLTFIESVIVIVVMARKLGSWKV